MIAFTRLGARLDRGTLVLALQFIGIGWYIAACIVIGLVSGRWLDQALSTAPLLMLVGLTLGIVTAFYGMYRMIVPLVARSHGTKYED